jgi:hypothetical protein
MRAAFVAFCTVLVLATNASGQNPSVSHEIWLVDQSNSSAMGGGRIYIYQDFDVAGRSKATPEVVDLAGTTAALCVARTGAVPVRPHMVSFNSTFSHAVLAFVASGHVVIIDAATRVPVECFRMSAGAGGARQAHAAFASPDDAFILVANQNGKLLERINTDYATGTFTHDLAATLDLVNGLTPNGVDRQLDGVRPDNAPICPVLDPTGALGFVTLRGGGLFVVQATATPMAIVGEYDMHAVHPNGCGGAVAAGAMFLNSGGGTASNLGEFDVYKFPLTGYEPANAPNTPAPVLIFSDDVDHRDSHGMLVTRDERFLWVADRTGNVIEVFDPVSGAWVNTIQLPGAAADDPSPDLMSLSPAGHRVYVSLRGPNPLTADPHASTGSTPGLGVLRVEQGGRGGMLQAVFGISNLDNLGVERADAHAIGVRPVTRGAPASR